MMMCSNRAWQMSMAMQAAMQERLTADEVKRGRPSPKQWSNQKIADWLAERAPLEATEGDQGVAGGQSYTADGPPHILLYGYTQ